ncbi:hypothetical protein MPNT_30067 [Candidatus Methylacidithermus pantelleriae]|uniref:Uncharacterized protein n=1 Tax=Candidatus Methylacidithermus pantelleriae TaxID=2744239 RepID=A0A8J2BQE3_9BACT|nr:hypothetical protein MPNT_30067 [Candidatus Methylacidithermus pantelleriae]
MCSWRQGKSDRRTTLPFSRPGLSTTQMASNQLRLCLSALTYILVEALRRLALRGMEWAEA